MEYLILGAIGLVMGIFGGLLGIGGSIIMIPALVIAFGENQHLYQASAMICNFFVGLSSAIVHRKANVVVAGIVKWLVPSAAVATIAGVAISNCSFFVGQRSYLLARIYGVFLLCVIIYNVPRFWVRPRGGVDGFDISRARYPAALTVLCGILSGIAAGLVGIGGGIMAVPAQQVFLKMPLKRAISNSAATIVAVAFVGSIYKNVTLPQHDISITESLVIALFVMPGAVAGAVVGSRIMHKLPVNLVRAVFIILAILASYEMLTVAPGT
jgi:hypothetical protein